MINIEGYNSVKSSEYDNLDIVQKIDCIYSNNKKYKDIQLKYDNLQSQYIELKGNHDDLIKQFDNLKKQKDESEKLRKTATEELEKKNEDLKKQKENIEKENKKRIKDLEKKHTEDLKKQKADLETQHRNTINGIRKKHKEDIKKQKTDIENTNKKVINDLKEEYEEDLKKQKEDLEKQYNNTIDGIRKKHEEDIKILKDNNKNEVDKYKDKILRYKKIFEIEKKNLIKIYVKSSYILMYLYKNQKITILSDLQKYINELTTPSIILTNRRSCNRVGIDLNMISYRPDDDEDCKQDKSNDIIKQFINQKNIKKSIALTLLRDEYDISIHELARLEMKIVFIHDLYALYLTKLYEGEEMGEVTIIAGLRDNEMEILKVTYKKDINTIECSFDYEGSFSIKKLIEKTKEFVQKDKDITEKQKEKIKNFTTESKDYLEKFIKKVNDVLSDDTYTDPPLTNFVSGGMYIIAGIEKYFKNKPDYYHEKVYLHLPNYTTDYLKDIKTELILDFSIDLSKGAIKFADSIYIFKYNE